MVHFPPNEGPPKQTEVGFLTLFEHYGYVQVGSHMKKPKSPVWVVCSESHYSVFFAPGGMPGDGEDWAPFDLHYYDELAAQDVVIRMTVTPGGGVQQESKRDEEMTPPLNHCIRTKWRNASIDWNGAEELL